MAVNPNLVFAAAAAGFLLTVLIVWIFLKRKGDREKTPICKDDIKWWREL